MKLIPADSEDFRNMPPGEVRIVQMHDRQYTINARGEYRRIPKEKEFGGLVNPNDSDRSPHPLTRHCFCTPCNRKRRQWRKYLEDRAKQTQPESTASPQQLPSNTPSTGLPSDSTST